MVSISEPAPKSNFCYFPLIRFHLESDSLPPLITGNDHDTVGKRSDGTWSVDQGVNKINDNPPESSKLLEQDTRTPLISLADDEIPHLLLSIDIAV